MGEFEEKPPIDDLLLVKTGTNVVSISPEDDVPFYNEQAMRAIARDIVDWENRGVRVALVTSAGITAGMIELGVDERPDPETETERSQVLSSAGWRPLLNRWQDHFGSRNTGGLQFTRQEIDNYDHERQSALTTIYNMLTFKHSDETRDGITPIINENDAITDEEIKYGDNDLLTAILAKHMGQSALFGSVRVVLLTDVNGLRMDPGDPSSRIEQVFDIEEVSQLASGEKTGPGTGSMKSKLEAARIVTESGQDLWIASGLELNPITRAIEADEGTRFHAKQAA